MIRSWGARLRNVGIVAAAVMSAGCHDKTAGENVLAVVNGEALTQDDFAADLAVFALPKGAGIDAVRPAVMNDMVVRSLLAQQARVEGFDKDPKYLAAAKRAQDIVLAQQLLSSVAKQVPTPTPQAAQAFIDRNPQIFLDRRLYLLDQIRTVRSGLDLPALDLLPSIDAVAEALRQQSHPFQRGSTTLDTLSLSTQAAREIAHLALGAPFTATSGDTVVFRAVVQSNPAPVPDSQRMAVAALTLRQENMHHAMTSEISALRARANIRYQ